MELRSQPLCRPYAPPPIGGSTAYASPNQTPPTSEETAVADLIFLGLGVGVFALFLGYAVLLKRA